MAVAQQVEVCLVEFLSFLGTPYLKLLKQFISSAIDQLRVQEGALLSQIAFTQQASIAINQGIGVAQLIANQVENALGSLPLGKFQECASVSTAVGTLRDSFGTVLDYFDNATNEANRVRAFTDVQSALSSDIDAQITYLENLSSVIDIVITQKLKSQAQIT